MGPAAIAALIQGAASLGSTVVNHFSSKSLNQNAYRQNLDMWKKQNEYNSPLQQVIRLRSAGLNPALAYGGSGEVVGNSETPPQLNYDDVVSRAPILPTDAFAQALDASAIVTNNDYSRAKTEESIKRAIYQGKVNGMADSMLHAQYDNLIAQTDQTYANISNLAAVSNKIGLESEYQSYLNYIYKHAQEYIIDGYFFDAEYKSRQIQDITYKLNKLNPQTLANLQKQCAYLGSEMELLSHQTVETDANTLKTLVSSKQISESISQIKATTDKLVSEGKISQWEADHMVLRLIAGSAGSLLGGAGSVGKLFVQ